MLRAKTINTPDIPIAIKTDAQPESERFRLNIKHYNVQHIAMGNQKDDV